MQIGTFPAVSDIFSDLLDDVSSYLYLLNLKYVLFKRQMEETLTKNNIYLEYDLRIILYTLYSDVEIYRNI